MKYLVCMSIHLIGLDIFGHRTKDSCLLCALRRTIEVLPNESLDGKIATLEQETKTWLIQESREHMCLTSDQVAVVFNSIVPFSPGA